MVEGKLVEKIHGRMVVRGTGKRKISAERTHGNHGY